MAVDWTKPIQFSNGGQCTLYATNPAGYPCYGRLPGNGPTRMIDNTAGGGPAFVFVYEDGVSATDAPRLNVENITENQETEFSDLYATVLAETLK